MTGLAGFEPTCDWRRPIRALACAAVLYLALPGVTRAETEEAAKAAADRRSSVSTLADYSEGTYGRRTTTAILYVPFSAAWVPSWAPQNRLELGLTVPYLWEHGRNIAATVGATRVRVSEATSSPRPRTEDGLGDVVGEASYVLTDDRGWMPEITPFLEIKFPTADSSRGLGTGAFDETLGVRLSKELVESVTGSWDLSYIFVGSAPRLHLRDIVTWSIGVTYDVVPALALSAFFEGSTAVERRQQDPLAIRVGTEYKLTTQWRVSAGATGGLSSGAPTFGVSIGLTRRF